MEDTKLFVCVLMAGIILINIGNSKYGFVVITVSIITFMIIRLINSGIDDSETNNKEIVREHKGKKETLIERIKKVDEEFIAASGKCEYCGTMFYTQKYDWVVENIEVFPDDFLNEKIKGLS